MCLTLIQHQLLRIGTLTPCEEAAEIHEEPRTSCDWSEQVPIEGTLLQRLKADASVTRNEDGTGFVIVMPEGLEGLEIMDSDPWTRLRAVFVNDTMPFLQGLENVLQPGLC